MIIMRYFIDSQECTQEDFLKVATKAIKDEGDMYTGAAVAQSFAETLNSLLNKRMFILSNKVFEIRSR